MAKAKPTPETKAQKNPIENTPKQAEQPTPIVAQENPIELKPAAVEPESIIATNTAPNLPKGGVVKLRNDRGFISTYGNEAAAILLKKYPNKYSIVK